MSANDDDILATVRVKQLKKKLQDTIEKNNNEIKQSQEKIKSSSFNSTDLPFLSEINAQIADEKKLKELNESIEKLQEAQLIYVLSAIEKYKTQSKAIDYTVIERIIGEAKTLAQDATARQQQADAALLDALNRPVTAEIQLDPSKNQKKEGTVVKHLKALKALLTPKRTKRNLNSASTLPKHPFLPTLTKNNKQNKKNKQKPEKAREVAPEKSVTKHEPRW